MREGRSSPRGLAAAGVRGSGRRAAFFPPGEAGVASAGAPEAAGRVSVAARRAQGSTDADPADAGARALQLGVAAGQDEQAVHVVARAQSRAGYVRVCSSFPRP